MFCKKCGNELESGDNFCDVCGNVIGKSKKSPQTQNRNQSISSSHNAHYAVSEDIRFIHIEYLKQILSYELVCNKMQSELNSYNSSINRLGYKKTLNSPVKENIAFSVYIAFIICLLIFIISMSNLISISNRIASYDFLATNFFAFLGASSMITGIILLIYMLYKTFSSKKEYKLNMSDYQINTKQDNERVSSELAQKARLKTIATELDKELSTAKRILSTLYSANIVPSEYRGLHGIHYITDFMATSKLQLNDAILHCKLDKIENKIDDLISQTIITQNLILSQNSDMQRKINSSYNNIITNLKSIDRNAEEAKSYSEMSANYSRASTWFSTANYIQNNYRKWIFYFINFKKTLDKSSICVYNQLL